MEKINKLNYYSIIPATILFNNQIKPNEKLLYAMLTSLASKEGFCFASNKYLAERLNVKANTVSSWITDLKRKGFIIVEIIRSDNNEIIQRKIYINDVPYIINKGLPSAINIEEGNLQKTKNNNKINNKNINKAVFDKNEAFLNGNTRGNFDQRIYTKEFLESLYAN